MAALTTKNIIYLVLWQLIFFTKNSECLRSSIDDRYNTFNVSESKGRHKRGAQSPPEININVLVDKGLISLKLKRTNQRLASDFVPIMIASSEGNDIKYVLQDRAMEQLGGFTMYQHFDTRSAVVYFHRLGIVDGVIGMDYEIRNLPLNMLHITHKVGGPYVTKRRFNSVGITNNENSCHNDRKFIVDEPKPEEKSLLFPKYVYPEIMVLVGYDVFENFPVKSTSVPVYMQIVSHLLVYFNAVDMLFSSFTEPIIEVNIARIVFEIEPEVFQFNNQFTCNSFMDYGETQIMLNTPAVLHNMAQYFCNTNNIFPRDSYDQVMYFTRNALAINGDESIWKPPLAGLSRVGLNGNYNQRIANSGCRTHQATSVVHVNNDYEGYYVASHEIAHMLHVHHDELPRSEIHTCGFIMQPETNVCVNCLRWSDRSKKEIKRYFKTRDHCFLLNIPRSLAPPAPRPTLTKYEQCQCYGFHCPLNLSQWDESQDHCSRELRCWDTKSREYNNAPMPIDGTPCGYGITNNREKYQRVCWNRQCVRAVNTML